jgi:hypothetical protein
MWWYAMIALWCWQHILSLSRGFLDIRNYQPIPSISRIRTAGSGSAGAVTVGVAVALVMMFNAIAGRAQVDRKRKIPVVSKITSGPNRQAFSGKVETLDLKRQVLEVNALEGKGMEIFPVKKGISVSTADGARMKLDELKPGTNVLIYYEQKGDRRTVKEIVVLAAGSDEDTKKRTPPS